MLASPAAASDSQAPSLAYHPARNAWNSCSSAAEGVAEKGSAEVESSWLGTESGAAAPPETLPELSDPAEAPEPPEPEEEDPGLAAEPPAAEAPEDDAAAAAPESDAPAEETAAPSCASVSPASVAAASSCTSAPSAGCSDASAPCESFLGCSRAAPSTTASAEKLIPGSATT